MQGRELRSLRGPTARSEPAPLEGAKCDCSQMWAQAQAFVDKACAPLNRSCTKGVVTSCAPEGDPDSPTDFCECTWRCGDPEKSSGFCRELTGVVDVDGNCPKRRRWHYVSELKAGPWVNGHSCVVASETCEPPELVPDTPMVRPAEIAAVEDDEIYGVTLVADNAGRDPSEFSDPYCGYSISQHKATVRYALAFLRQNIDLVEYAICLLYGGASPESPDVGAFLSCITECINGERPDTMNWHIYPADFWSWVGSYAPDCDSISQVDAATQSTSADPAAVVVLFTDRGYVEEDLSRVTQEKSLHRATKERVANPSRWTIGPEMAKFTGTLLHELVHVCDPFATDSAADSPFEGSAAQLSECVESYLIEWQYLLLLQDRFPSFGWILPDDLELPL